MLIYPDSPVPTEAAPEEMTSVVPPADGNAEAATEAATKDTTEATAETAAEATTETAAETATETATETAAETAVKPPVASPVVAARPAYTPPRPQPWAVVVRRFTIAPPNAYQQLNKDFGLALSARSYAALQNLFRNVLRRDPTVGEILLLDALGRRGRHAPRREGVGELYTDSPAIAETWADMMAKHSELYAAAGLLRKEPRTPPPCTLEDALTLISRYLHRTGRVAPLTDSLPFGGKNSDGRTAVLSTPAQEAEAIARGYTPVKPLNLGSTTRSLWVRRGGEITATPSANGDFLVYLPSPDPSRLAELLKTERSKHHPTIRDVVPLLTRSPLEAVLTLCDGADLYATRFPRPTDKSENGAKSLLHLCRTSVPPPNLHPDYLLCIPGGQVRELSEALRSANLAAVSVGQVRADGRIRILLRQGNVDIPVAELTADLLRTDSSPILYRRRVEAAPCAESPQATLLKLPEEGLVMAATAITVTDADTGYAAAMAAVAAAVSPLTAYGSAPQPIRLSVSLTVSDSESGLGSHALGVLCGLYRAAAEGCMAMEDPAFTVEAPVSGQDAPLRLSVVAYRLI